MAGLSRFVSILTQLLLFIIHSTKSCGVTTHIEIGHRALQTFHTGSPKIHTNFEQLMKKHQDAFQAGNTYPDAYYSNACFKGKYHSISEDTHWTPFMNATINYIRRHYPQPWDEATEKLVVFLFGFVSHQVADVPWHSLGINQGFLDTMGKLNFHGSFSTAHPIGDFGGDILTQYELTLPYIGEIQEWYIPTADLESIYQEFYGQNLLPVNVIVDCTTLLYIVCLEVFRFLIVVVVYFQLFPDYASKSPYLVDKLEDYFLGGLDDMAAQTQDIWQDTAFMLEFGTSACRTPYNPLYINCDATWTDDKGGRPRNGYYRLPYLAGLDHSSINITKTKRGVHLSPSKKYLSSYKKLHDEQRTERVGKNTWSAKSTNLDPLYWFSTEYSKLGWSMASGDVNKDGYDDVILGSPGWATTGSIQQGRVYILYGSTDGLPTNMTEKMTVIDGPYKGRSKFGSSVAVVDINRDGVADVAVGAPSLSQDGSYLDYRGMVYVYFGNAAGRMAQPNMTISCQAQFCNWGLTMTTGDLNNDGHPDLLIGSPYALGGGEQRGVVGGLFSSQTYTVPDMVRLTTEQLDWVMAGDQDYGWFGSSLVVKNSWIVIGQSVFRICAESNCSYSQKDKQSVGRIHILKASSKGPVLKQTLIGRDEFGQFGTSLAIGRPYDNQTDVLAVSSTTSSVDGAMFKVKQVWQQAGQIYLYNLTDLCKQQNQLQEQKISSPIATFSGNRRFGRFGAAIEFCSTRRKVKKGSTICNQSSSVICIMNYLLMLIILFEICIVFAAEEGRVFIFNGGDHFPRGNATYGCHGDIEPCPEEKADVVLSYNNQEEKARFGRSLTVASFRQKSSLVISAAHSSWKSVRLQGAVGVYSVNKHSEGKTSRKRFMKQGQYRSCG
ncbi:phosphatidylinositol-glycan-specific phospholipase D-like [Liolophura sinensis]|uniref:phosphatidylinositol-glycan-specific phospholipase D-like n=1 Tax=Liolophura sinensis TaxID=3198878 RepID=UPI003158A250